MSLFDEIYRPKKFAKDRSEEFARKYPHKHVNFLTQPDISRRRFFEIAGAGLTGSYLLTSDVARAASTDILSAGVATKNTAKNVIFIFLPGAISQVDTFDFKGATGTPADALAKLAPSTVGGIKWPTGLLPKLGAQLGDIALVRSMSAWALVHSLAQTWTQIGRNPVAALGDIAPNLGSIVAIEKETERKTGQIFPGFVALNTGSGPGAGYFPASYGPFRVTASRNTQSTGLPNTTNPNAASASLFDGMYNRMRQYEGGLRSGSPYGKDVQDYDAFFAAGKNMMYNPTVTQAFNFTAADSTRYGATTFGNACLIAKQLIQANQGTRFVQISQGGWDMHQNIYTDDAQSIFGMAPQLDNGVAALIADLKASGLLGETMVVMVAEFGRTPALSAAAGRDHFLLQTAMLAGGGVKGGKVIGTTNADGSAVTDFGWAGSGNTGPRYVRPEDIVSTVLSGLGIDWTTVRRDDPFGRGFEYVPFASAGTYGPINELWS